MSALSSGNSVKTGGDPRTQAEFSMLKEEIAKLSHPARPDVNWSKVEQLSLTLFRQNGVELQTAAWFTLARTQRAGLVGIHEGLQLIDGLLTHQWPLFWPQQTHARVEILAWLVARLQQVLRTQEFQYGDLALIYRIEKVLEHLCYVLQRLDLKHLSKLDGLRNQMHHAALRLESLESGATAPRVTEIQMEPEGAFQQEITSSSPLVYIIKEPAPLPPPLPAPEPEPERVAEEPARWKSWHGFVAGVAISLLVGAGTWWGITTFRLSGTEQVLQEMNRPLPQLMEPAQLANMQQADHRAELARLEDAVVQASGEQLLRLDALPALWALNYGNLLVQQLGALWPASPQVKQLAEQWQQQRESRALSKSAMQDWHLAQTSLQQLADKLNALDTQRGRYITVSELKSIVFAIQQPMNRTPPLEELLRQLEEQQRNGKVSPALQTQIDSRLTQLLNRYALLTAPAQ
ncbi:VasL domain-containing protein [Serratia sp. L9]|uniref:VasL domain-containing protein n=1 Tax=Serratia sp. L9 TaxID=3423946 RepID=UPI003D67FDD6